MNLLDPEELRRLLPAESHAYPSPIPTQVVSSDEFMPGPQTRPSAGSRRGSRSSAASWAGNKA